MTKKTILTLVAAATLAAGFALAQPPGGPAPGPNVRARAGRLARHLELTPEQREQARTIFREAFEQAKPVAAQRKQARQDMAAAIKAQAPEADIDRIAAQMGTINGQLVAVRSKAFAKFYAILTPEQREKVDARMIPVLPAAFGPGRPVRN